MEEEPYFYHPLENIEDVDIFYEAVGREHLVKKISEERPYTYWTIEYYDQENGIRGGGGLGILAADTRRVAEQLGVPFALITPFYPSQVRQKFENGKYHDELIEVNYQDFGYKMIDSVNVRCDNNLCQLDVLEKRLGTTRIIAIYEPNFRELYADLSFSDHRLYQEVSLGFGGYYALKLLGLKPAVMQLNEVATFFGALARLDELVHNGMDFYESVVYTRKHTLYTNHTLVQAAEAEFTLEQFERYVFPNIKSLAVKKWLRDRFENERIKLSTVVVEIAELKNGVSKLHARLANYRDASGERVKFKAITNGIDIKKWTLPAILDYYHENQILDSNNMPTPDYKDNLNILTSEKIRELKDGVFDILNEELASRPNQYGKIVKFSPNERIISFKRRMVDYKRPEMPFKDPVRLRNILEEHNAHYIICGKVHRGDEKMFMKLHYILDVIDKDDYLREHVHYYPDLDEKISYAISVASDVSLNLPMVGYEACGTSWMKDVINFTLLVSTHDGGVADGSMDAYLNVSGKNESEELDMFYQRLEESLQALDNDFELEYLVQNQLKTFLPTISGARMFKEYLSLLFPA